MVQKIRRFVTGHNAAGKAIVMIDDHAPNATEIKGWPGLGVTELWVTDEMPVEITAQKIARCARCATIRRRPAPSSASLKSRRKAPAARSIQRAAFGHLGSTNKPTERKLRQTSDHAQDQLDRLSGRYFGSMHMLMEEGEVELHAGDCIVQRGTNHAWVNRSGKPCLLAAVLIDAKSAPVIRRRETAGANEPGRLGRKMGARRARSG